MRMTLVYARIADKSVADEYFAVTEKVEAQQSPGACRRGWLCTRLCSRPSQQDLRRHKRNHQGDHQLAVGITGPNAARQGACQ
jgi:hypothetical protein